MGMGFWVLQQKKQKKTGKYPTYYIKIQLGKYREYTTNIYQQLTFPVQVEHNLQQQPHKLIYQFNLSTSMTTHSFHFFSFSTFSPNTKP